MTHSSLFFHASFSLRMSKNDKNMIRKNELKKDHISTGSPQVLHGFSMGRSVLSLSVRSQALGTLRAPCALYLLSPFPDAPLLGRLLVAGGRGGCRGRRGRGHRAVLPLTPRNGFRWLQMASDGFRWLQMASGSAWSDMVSITGSVDQ
jgi:hypothetical protein